MTIGPDTLFVSPDLEDRLDLSNSIQNDVALCTVAFDAQLIIVGSLVHVCQSTTSIEVEFRAQRNKIIEAFKRCLNLPITVTVFEVSFGDDDVISLSNVVIDRCHVAEMEAGQERAVIGVRVKRGDS